MKDYRSTHMVAYEEPAEFGQDCLPVLPYLWGRRWDELALAYVHSLQPSCIRVTPGEIKLDFRMRRVTVYVSPGGFIQQIEQEVEIGWIEPKDRLDVRSD